MKIFLTLIFTMALLASGNLWATATKKDGQECESEIVQQGQCTQTTRSNLKGDVRNSATSKAGGADTSQ